MVYPVLDQDMNETVFAEPSLRIYRSPGLSIMTGERVNGRMVFNYRRYSMNGDALNIGPPKHNHVNKRRMNESVLQQSVDAVGRTREWIRGTELESLYRNGYKPNFRQRLHNQHQKYVIYAAENDFDLRDNNVEAVRNMIEDNMFKVYSILSGKGPRAWFKRVKQVNEIILGGNGTGLIADIEKALLNETITEEYAATTTNYIKDLMNESMTRNRSFKRALQGSKWENVAYDNIDSIDTLIDGHGLVMDTGTVYSKDYLKYHIEKEMLDNEFAELGDAIINSYKEVGETPTILPAESPLVVQVVDNEETSGFLSRIPNRIGKWISKRWSKAA